jgi:hypothetical protein
MVAQVDRNKSVMQCHVVALQTPDAAIGDKTMNKDHRPAGTLVLPS